MSNTDHTKTKYLILLGSIAAKLGAIAILLHAFGYIENFHDFRHATAFLICLYLVSKLIPMAVNRLYLKHFVDGIVEEFTIHSFPDPREYVNLDPTKNEIWFGQNYLESVQENASLPASTRIAATKIVTLIHRAESTDFFEERRLMKITLAAAIEYARRLPS